MTITKYRPRPSFVTPFSDLMNDLFNHDIGHFVGRDDLHRGSTAVNITESPDSFHLRMLAPGFAKADLKLKVEDHILTVSAEKKNEELKENERWTRREFNHTAISRSFRLPETVDTEAITADLTDGVLHLRIPKMEAAKPRTREINIG